MTTRQYSSRSQQTTLTGTISAGATSMTVVSGTALLGGVTIPSGRTFTLVIDPDTALEEIVDATAVSTNTFTITRAIDGSSGQTHSAGAVVRHMAIGRDYRDANLHAEADASYNDGAGVAHTMHGIGAGEGVVVGTLKTQTLTNKTLTTPTISGGTLSGAVTVAATATVSGHIVVSGGTITGLSSAGMVTSSATPKDYVDAILGSATAASTSAAAANTSAVAASTSAANASASASAASTSAAAANTSAVAASTSAAAASVSQASATTSAAAANTSAVNASTSAANASASQAAANTSAVNASTSAANASASAAAASTSSASATLSAAAASTSAANASTSAANASTSATAASTSQAAANTSAVAASTSAANASASAAAANTSAVNASTSAASASASAASATTSQAAANTSAVAASTSAASASVSATAASSSATLVQASSNELIEFRQYSAEGSVLNNVPSRVHPAENLLKQAVWWIDAAHSGSSGQTITNLGWGGSALNVTNGSSTSSDSNDALYLGWDGTNYVYLPGSVTNYLSIPDANNLDITGDLDLRVQITQDDWSPSTEAGLIGKWTSVGNQRSYALALATNGTFILYWSTDGTASTSKSSTVGNGLTDGTTKWVRATLDVDNGASGNDVKFFLSDDGITWTQLGSTVTTAGITSIYSGTASANIGTFTPASSGPFAGKVFRGQILNGIDGTPVLDVDTSVITSGAATSFTALTGQTVTVNRSTSGRKTVCVVNPVWLFGTDDYMEVNNRWLEHTGTNYLYLPGVASNNATAPDSAALDVTGDIDLRCKVALDDWTPTADSMFLAKRTITGNQQSYFFYINSTGFLTLGWTTGGSVAITKSSTVATGLTDGAVKWVRATLDVDNGASGNDVKFFLSDDGTNWTQLGSTVTTAGTTSIYSGTSTLEIGSQNGGVNPARGKFFRAQVLNGIGGTVAFDANFESSITAQLPTTFTESSANSATVTVNYSGTGYRSAGVLASTYVYPGNPNTFKLSTYSFLDFGASDSFTLVAIARQWATPTSYGVFFEKRQTSPNNGYSLTNNATNYRPEVTISDGTTSATNSSVTPVSAAGAITTYSMIVDRSAQTLYFNVNGTSSATVGTSSVGNISSYFPFAVGRRTYTAGLYNDMEFIAGAVFRRVLTAGEITTLNTYFQGRIGG